MCASILDQLADDDSIIDLVDALNDGDVEVCKRALHALACDQCKQNECRPTDDLFVPQALELIRSHASADIRAAAIDAVGRAAGRRPELVEALVEASAHERDPGLRQMARRRVERARRRRR